MALIQVIDDEPSIALLLKEILISNGHSVNTAFDGLSGLKQIGSEPLPDIILVDLDMPVMNGKSFVDTIRSKPKLQNIPVIIISGQDLGYEGFPPKGSFQAFIAKPFDPIEVLKTVSDLLLVSVGEA